MLTASSAHNKQRPQTVYNWFQLCNGMLQVTEHSKGLQSHKRNSPAARRQAADNRAQQSFSSLRGGTGYSTAKCCPQTADPWDSWATPPTRLDGSITATPPTHLVCEGGPAHHAACSTPAGAIPGDILRHGCPQCRAVDVHGSPIRQLCCDLQLCIRIGLPRLPATACPTGAFSRCRLVCKHQQQPGFEWLVAAHLHGLEMGRAWLPCAGQCTVQRHHCARLHLGRMHAAKSHATLSRWQVKVDIRLGTHQQVCPPGLQGPQPPETPGRTGWCRTSSPLPPQSWKVHCAYWASSCSCCRDHAMPAWHTLSDQCKIQPCLQHRERPLMLAQTQLRLSISDLDGHKEHPLWYHACSTGGMPIHLGGASAALVSVTLACGGRSGCALNSWCRTTALWLGNGPWGCVSLLARLLSHLLRGHKSRCGS